MKDEIQNIESGKVDESGSENEKVDESDSENEKDGESESENEKDGESESEKDTESESESDSDSDSGIDEMKPIKPIIMMELSTKIDDMQSSIKNIESILSKFK